MASRSEGLAVSWSSDLGEWSGLGELRQEQSSRRNVSCLFFVLSCAGFSSVMSLHLAFVSFPVFCFRILCGISWFFCVLLNQLLFLALFVTFLRVLLSMFCFLCVFLSCFVFSSLRRFFFRCDVL